MPETLITIETTPAGYSFLHLLVDGKQVQVTFVPENTEAVRSALARPGVTSDVAATVRVSTAQRLTDESTSGYKHYTPEDLEFDSFGPGDADA